MLSTTNIPATMRAARFYTAGDLRIEEIPTPQPADLGPLDILMRVRECGICGTDLHEYAHGPIHSPVEPHPVTGVSVPVIPGHEFSGEIVAVGDRVTSVTPGDPVAAMPQIYCGECSQCLAGRQHTCENLAATGYSGAWGGLAEYAILRENQVAKLHTGMSFALGALVEPTAVAVHSFESTGLRPGGSLLVTGGGPIGQLVALVAQASGAGTVVLSEPNATRRALAEQLGVTRIVDPTSEDLAAITRELTGGGFDACIEASGSQPALDACLANITLGGTIVQTAMTVRPTTFDAAAQLTMRDVTYRGVYTYPVTSWPRVIGLMDSDNFPVEQVVTNTVDLEDLTDAYDALADPNGSDLKILIRL